MGDYALVFERLEEIGLLLLTDVDLPSVAGLVAGEPVRGSWWGHARAQEIFAVSERLAEHPDVTSVKLVKAKVTFVHRRLWGALVAVGQSRASWQLRGLPDAALPFLERLEREGHARSDRLGGFPGGAGRGEELVRQLEKRLLLHSESVHTERGAHAKFLESWRHWAFRVELGEQTMDEKGGRKALDGAVHRLSDRPSVASLPWTAGNA